LYYGSRGDRGTLTLRNATARQCIQIAYGVKDVFGGPGWVSTEGFDIEAKTGTAGMTGTQMLLRFRALLAERFSLTLRSEVKDSPVYFVVMGRKGVVMKPSADQTGWLGDYPDGAPDGRVLTGGGPSELGPDRIVGEAIPMTMLTNLLAGPLGRKVINKTGLTGRYDIELRWSPEGDSGVSLFTAVQEQLGLRLEAGKGPVETLAIDHIERPSGN
jgi:uncharacterized protein (TIGR03435 family)